MSGADKNDWKSEYTHHNAEVVQVEPEKVEVDEFNERNTGVGPQTDLGDLEKSIAEDGIENFPHARPAENGDKYKVFAGQRRLLAAKAVGLPEIPLIVKELDDMEALAASVNENNEHLDKDVSRKDRAAAVEKIVEEWDYERAADKFGVDEQTIKLWLEPKQDFWSGTIFDPDVNSELDTEYIADDLLATIRRVTRDRNVAEKIAKQVIESNVPPDAVRNAAEIADGPHYFWKEIKEQWEADIKGHDQIRPRITLTGEDVERLQAWAKDRGMNKKRAVKQIVIERLEREQQDDIAISELDEDIFDDLRSVCDERDLGVNEVLEQLLSKWLYWLIEYDHDQLSIIEEMNED